MSGRGAGSAGGVVSAGGAGVHASKASEGGRVSEVTSRTSAGASISDRVDVRSRSSTAVIVPGSAVRVASVSIGSVAIVALFGARCNIVAANSHTHIGVELKSDSAGIAD